METISLKLDKSLLDEIDSSLKKNRFGTRTEFIRDSIRCRLSRLEKDEAIRKLAKLKGSMKGIPPKMSEEEAGELAFRKAAARHGIRLD